VFRIQVEEDFFKKYLSL